MLLGFFLGLHSYKPINILLETCFQILVLMKLFMPNIIHITQLDNLSPIVSVWEQFIYIFVKITIHKT